MADVNDGMLERGVHRAPWTEDGCAVLVAITSAGELQGRERVEPAGGDVDEDALEEALTLFLEGMLDHRDPLPTRPALATVR